MALFYCCIVLYCLLLYCTVLLTIVLSCIVLYCIVLSCLVSAVETEQYPDGKRAGPCLGAVPVRPKQHCTRPTRLALLLAMGRRAACSTAPSFENLTAPATLHPNTPQTPPTYTPSPSPSPCPRLRLRLRYPNTRHPRPHGDVPQPGDRPPPAFACLRRPKKPLRRASCIWPSSSHHPRASARLPTCPPAAPPPICTHLDKPQQ